MAELKQRVFFVLGALIIYRIGAHIPVPGINVDMLSKFFADQEGGVWAIFNMFSGGALSRFTVFALGIMPYISASIIMQLLVVVSPRLEQIKKEGEAGRRQITKYTRYSTVLLATLQASGVAIALQSQPGLVFYDGFAFFLTTTLSLVCGTMFLMWLGEQITERGIGNGISIIIFAGIVAGLPNAVVSTLKLVSSGAFNPVFVIFLLIAVIGITIFVVFMEQGQRRIPVTYAKYRTNQMAGKQVTHLPLKLNMAGVIPLIFASSIILFPVTIANWFGSSPSMSWLKDVGEQLSPGQPLYILLFVSAVIFFCFFYTALIFNPKETADNLKKGGGFIQGIRPGEQTAKYIDQIMGRLTLLGSIYLVVVSLVPEFLIMKFRVPFYFGGTSLLIIVVVTMDLIAQIKSLLMSQQYKGLLEKVNFGNR